MTRAIPKKVISLYRPTQLTINNTSYLVISGSEKDDGWYPIKRAISTKAIQKMWTPWTKEKTDTLAGAWTWKIQNSKKNGYYTVSFDRGGWSCDCTGFGYRRKCRHIDEAKTKMN